MARSIGENQTKQNLLSYEKECNSRETGPEMKSQRALGVMKFEFLIHGEPATRLLVRK